MQSLKRLSVLFLFLISLSASAQNADSTSFEAQRMRVNKLIEDRKVKFGEYDMSLEKKTGIFGLFKSKDDMQKTIDILKISSSPIIISFLKHADLSVSKMMRNRNSKT